MLSSTSTPDELRSELEPFSGLCWRVVEPQHRISTIPLVDTLDEQKRLEEILEATKPLVPPDCKHLDPLLRTPFRYEPYRHGSRFRRAGQREGVFYSAESVETAVAEMAFYRVLFFAESPETTIDGSFTEYSAFAVSVASGRVVDLTKTTDATLRDLADYTASQAFADLARAAAADGIRTTSVRCPNQGPALSWLTCRVFTKAEPVVRQSWHMRITRRGVQAVCESPYLGLELPASGFSTDPRIANFSWSRAP